MKRQDVLYLIKQDKEDLTKRWIPNYKLLFQLFSSIQKYFSIVLNIPQNKIINQGYQEFFTKYFFNLDRYRKFLEKVNPPYIIYNIQSYEIDRSKLNKTWNDEGVQQQELEKYYLYIQRSYLTQGLNISLYLDNREQLLQYLSYLIGTFDLPNGQLNVEYDLTEFIPDDEPTLQGNRLIFTDYITLINPTSYEDSSEYLFDEQMRTFKLTFSFNLEGYVLTKLRFYNKEEEGISTFILNSSPSFENINNEYTKLQTEEEYNLTIEFQDTQMTTNLLEIQKQNIESKDDLDIVYYEILLETENGTYTLTPQNFKDTSESEILEMKTITVTDMIYFDENSNDFIMNTSMFENLKNDTIIDISYNNSIFRIPITNDLIKNDLSIKQLIESQIGEQVDLNLINYVNLKTEYKGNVIDEKVLISKDEENNTLVLNEVDEINGIQNVIKVSIDSDYVLNIESDIQVNTKINYIVNNRYTVYTTTNLDTGDVTQDIPSGELHINLKITKDENGKPIIKNVSEE